MDASTSTAYDALLAEKCLTSLEHGKLASNFDRNRWRVDQIHSSGVADFSGHGTSVCDESISAAEKLVAAFVNLSRFNLSKFLESIEAIEEAIAIVRLVGFKKTADRLQELNQAKEDLDEGEEPLNLGALRNFAVFLNAYPEFREPRLGLAADGTITAEWEYGPSRRLAIKFSVAPQEIVFAVIAPPNSISKYPRLNGRGSHSEVVKILRVFGVLEWALDERRSAA